MDLIKCAKSRLYQKINVPSDTKQLIRKIAINNIWNTYIVHIFRDKHDESFILKENSPSRLPIPVEISHEWVNTNFEYHEPEFTLYCLMGHKTDLLKSLLDM